MKGGREGEREGGRERGIEGEHRRSEKEREGGGRGREGGREGGRDHSPASIPGILVVPNSRSYCAEHRGTPLATRGASRSVSILSFSSPRRWHMSPARAAGSVVSLNLVLSCICKKKYFSVIFSSLTYTCTCTIRKSLLHMRSSCCLS